MKYIVMIIITIIYVVIGVFIQDKRIIIHPASFALYGSIYGIIMEFIALKW